MLNTEAPVQGISIADVLVQAGHVRGERRRASGQWIGNWIRQAIKRSAIPRPKQELKEVEVEALQVIAGETESGTGEHRAVENPEASSNHSLSASERIPGKANARTEIIAVGVVKRLADRIQGQRGDIEIADQIALQDSVVFIAQTQVDGKSGSQADIILHKEVVVCILYANLVVTEGAELERLGLLEIRDSVERQEFLGLQRVVSNRVADIEARFNRVFAFHPGQGIQKLKRVLRTET